MLVNNVFIQSNMHTNAHTNTHVSHSVVMDDEMLIIKTHTNNVVNLGPDIN